MVMYSSQHSGKEAHPAEAKILWGCGIRVFLSYKHSIFIFFNKEFPVWYGNTTGLVYLFAFNNWEMFPSDGFSWFSSMKTLPEVQGEP